MAAAEPAMADIGQGVQPGHQVVALEDEADFAAKPAQGTGGEAPDRPAQDLDLALVGLDQPHAATQERGLAGPVGAEQRHCLPLADSERHATQNRNRPE